MTPTFMLKIISALTPDEAALSHKLFTAALASWKNGTLETL